MKYIYDINLNFNEILYDFFEWNKSDNIIHTAKIPIIEIKKKDFVNSINNIVSKNIITLYMSIVIKNILLFITINNIN